MSGWPLGGREFAERALHSKPKDRSLERSSPSSASFGTPLPGSLPRDGGREPPAPAPDRPGKGCKPEGGPGRERPGNTCPAGGLQVSFQAGMFLHIWSTQGVPSSWAPGSTMTSANLSFLANTGLPSPSLGQLLQGWLLDTRGWSTQCCLCCQLRDPPRPFLIFPRPNQREWTKTRMEVAPGSGGSSGD